MEAVVVNQRKRRRVRTEAVIPTVVMPSWPKEQHAVGVVTFPLLPTRSSATSAGVSRSPTKPSITLRSSPCLYFGRSPPSSFLLDRAVLSDSA